MSGDQRRDRQQSNEKLRAFPEAQKDASSVGDLVAADDSEFEHPTRPRGRTIADSASSSESRIRVNAPAHRASPDSFNPVRVAARSNRPLSLWTRAWATVALVIVASGGAVGIVASLRGRTFGGWRSAKEDPSGAVATQAAARGAEGVARPVAMPAAAPGVAAQPPIAPMHEAARNAAPPSVSAPAERAPEATSTAAPAGVPPRAADPALYRTIESLAVSPPIGHAAGASSSAPRRAKPAETEPRSDTRTLRTVEANEAPASAPAPSDTPEPKGESEAWVTEERRF